MCHETLFPTDYEARAPARIARQSATGRDANPYHEDGREPVRGQRFRAFSQDRRRTQAQRGLIPILMLYGLDI